MTATNWSQLANEARLKAESRELYEIYFGQVKIAELILAAGMQPDDLAFVFGRLDTLFQQLSAERTPPPTQETKP